MASNYHDDWQSSKKTVLQRNAYMFDNELMSDVSFTCGESSRIFYAHKYVLATSSAVFYAMFYGNLAQQESPIRIPDAEEQSFEEFLRFLDVDKCDIRNAETAMNVLYLAKKYLVSSLIERCCKVLPPFLTPDNAFPVLEQAVYFDEKELEAKCWVVLSTYTVECISSEAFCDIALQTLNALLKRQNLTITEVELFKAVLRWTDSECARQGINIEEDKTARRRVLGDNVHEIRFSTLSQEDFAKYVVPAGVLTDAEIESIYQKFWQVNDLKWKQQKRGPRILGFRRFEPGDRHVHSWTYKHNGPPDALTLIVNKLVLFHGVRLFGSSCDSRPYEVNFTIKNRCVEGHYTSEPDDDGVWGYNVMLLKPIPLLPRENVAIIAKIKGPRSDNGFDGKPSAKIDTIILKFKKPELPGLSRNYTSQQFGQFYKVFLSKLQ